MRYPVVTVFGLFYILYASCLHLLGTIMARSSGIAWRGVTDGVCCVKSELYIIAFGLFGIDSNVRYAFFQAICM